MIDDACVFIYFEGWDGISLEKTNKHTPTHTIKTTDYFTNYPKSSLFIYSCMTRYALLYEIICNWIFHPKSSCQSFHNITTYIHDDLYIYLSQWTLTFKKSITITKNHQLWPFQHLYLPNQTKCNIWSKFSHVWPLPVIR